MHLSLPNISHAYPNYNTKHAVSLNPHESIMLKLRLQQLYNISRILIVSRNLQQYHDLPEFPTILPQS